MEIFTWITPDCILKRKPRVLSAQFGDGYGQDSPDGLNANLQTWELTFEDIYKHDGIAIDEFLTARKGAEAFEWTTPLQETLAFKCREWDVKPTNKSRLLTVTCTFTQVAA